MNPSPTSTESPTDWDKRDEVNSLAFQLIVVAMTITQGALIYAVYRNWLWLMIPLALLGSHFMHGILVGFHEASHLLLRKNRKLNEFDGLLIGVLSFMSFTLYRTAHQTHHAHLATERDEELWPFVFPSAPRWGRVLAAVLELTLGLFFTPFLFLRTFLRKGTPIRSPRVRRRIWMELGIMVLFWAAVFSLVTWFGMWKYFLWVFLIPALLAGNMQSWRKYIEHVGLTGSTVNSATRNIISNSIWGRALAYTLLHEPYHGVHHLRSGLPHPFLPKHASLLEPTHEDEVPPFPSYWSAVRDLARQLPNPRVGAQWRRGTVALKSE